ncbi:hypothetical protein BDN71DRAFT_1451330 [Pleurotus eryngii]|uniref:Uncharacterized protein n=1 Tax=Pleurotus eryngii TaxID=5323 RepID=A0A9P6D618_PLEER|nr:hypothetical protein BDN71DRAFT_1451330 [Pleurotus eryngii]
MCHGRWLEVPELRSKERQEERGHGTMYIHRYCSSSISSFITFLNVPFNARPAQHFRCTVRRRIPSSYHITNGSRSCRVTMEDVFPTVTALEPGWGTLRCRASERILPALQLHESQGTRIRLICGGTINSTALRQSSGTSRTHHPLAEVTVPPPPPSRPHVSPLALPLVSPARSLYQCYHGAPREGRAARPSQDILRQKLVIWQRIEGLVRKYGTGMKECGNARLFISLCSTSLSTPPRDQQDVEHSASICSSPNQQAEKKRVGGEVEERGWGR